MSELITVPSSMQIATVLAPLPPPRVGISIRVATLCDLAFIDGLQKKTSKMVGFMPTKQIEGKIAAGEVLVAEADSPRRRGGAEKRRAESRRCEGAKDREVSEPGTTSHSSRPFAPSSLRDSSSVTPRLRGERIGYLIGCDRYFKRDDVGIIYAINVVPEYRRSLVAAALLKAQFERSAYGCKLYCCWCAQDLEANRFWESMGFVALAYRAGGVGSRQSAVGREKKTDASPTSLPTAHRPPPTPRVHIFWQKRIRAGDTSTPWWFPSKTTGGSIREDRIVLPMRPGMHWSDAQPLILPDDGGGETGGTQPVKAIASRGDGLGTTRGIRKKKAIEQPRLTPLGNGLLFAIPQPGEALPEMKANAKPAKAKAVRVKRKTDPALAAAARELRDRWLETVNGQSGSPTDATAIGHAAKYEVSRELPPPSRQMLPAA